ncbi:MAG: hypothetical protein GX453_08555 [Lactococcus chungangensis]|uniref:SipW-cognate class signal peptide n=1 Tax=Pseudolactococcus chungangensis TaxID=451457 RepID=A0A847J6B6_9LACT|nr:hypothetical protein [Lactococcus chungangensis]
MKLTKKRLAIVTAAAALVTAGIFGGTYAKYHTETLPTTDNARLAKFYLNSENTLDLFKTEYTNTTGIGTDVKNDGSDTKNLIAPNVTTTQNLTFKVATEVKSQLDFSGLTIDTNLPKELQQFILVQVCGVYHGLDALVADPSVVAYNVVTVPAGDPSTEYHVPLSFTWNLDNREDAKETAAAIEQALASKDYYLKVTGQATLTQID